MTVVRIGRVSGMGDSPGRPVAVTLWFLQAGPSTSSALLHTRGKSMPTSRRRIPTRLHRLPHCQAVSAWISAVIAWATAVSLARAAGPLLRSRKATSAPRTVEVAVHHARRCGPTSIEWFRWPGGRGLTVAWEPRSALVSVPGGRAERLGVLMSRMRGIIEA